jgi:hypothetical protein
MKQIVKYNCLINYLTMLLRHVAVYFLKKWTRGKKCLVDFSRLKKNLNKMQ